MTCLVSVAQITISGHIDAKRLVLANAGHFSCQAPVRPDGRFLLTCEADTGYYTLNDSILYLEPGMKVRIDAQDAGWTFSGKGANENRLMRRLNAMIGDFIPAAADTLSDKANMIQPDSFYHSLQIYRDKALAMLAGCHCSPSFLKTQRDQLEYVIKYYTRLQIINYGVDPERKAVFLRELRQIDPNDQSRLLQKSMTYGSVYIKRPTSKEWQLYYSDQMRDIDMNLRDLYAFSAEYKKLLNDELTDMLNNSASPNAASRSQDEKTIDAVNAKITDSFIREDLLYRLTLSDLKRKGKNAAEYYSAYLEHTDDTIHADNIRAVKENMDRYSPGAEAPAFTFRGVDGAPVSLSDLRGHYVYIDIWATWCEPCIHELPYLLAVGKKYDGKNIRFIGISVDKPKDSASWRQFVMHNGMQGVQVLADHDFSSGFISSLGIISIPRFILIDPAGKIVDADAARPSDPQLSRLIDKLMSQAGGRYSDR